MENTFEPKYAFKLGSDLYDGERMQDIFNLIQDHLPEDVTPDFNDFFKNMNEVVLSCNLLKMKDPYAEAYLDHI